MDVTKVPSEQPSYKSDFNQSVQLFEKSFHAMQQSKFDEQRHQYTKVMKESLQTMQESANAMLNKHLLALKNDLSHDLDEYLQQPTDEHRRKVESDINSLKRG